MLQLYLFGAKVICSEFHAGCCCRSAFLLRNVTSFKRPLLLLFKINRTHISFK